MKKLFFLILLLPAFAKAQTFYVSGRDPKSKDVVERKMAFDGYNLTDSSKADYVLHLLSDGHYSFVKMSYQGYIKIVDNKTGEEVSRTRIVKRNPAALNGYNASYDIFRVISKKYLADELKKCKKSTQG